jgi:hypothetical protein
VTLWRAVFETPHLTLEAYGVDCGHALEVLARAWALHSSRSGADPGYLEEYAEDVQVMAVTAGTCYRDGEPYPRWPE